MKITEEEFYKSLYEAVINKSINSLLLLAYSIWGMPISMIDIDYNVLGMYPAEKIGDKTYDEVIENKKITSEEKRKFIDERYLMSLHKCTKPFIINWGVAIENHRYSYKLALDGINYGAVSMVLLNSYTMNDEDEAHFLKIAEAAAKILSCSKTSSQISATNKSLIIRFLLSGVDVNEETIRLYLERRNTGTKYILALATNSSIDSPFYGEDIAKRVSAILKDSYINLIDDKLYALLEADSTDELYQVQLKSFKKTILKYAPFRIFVSAPLSDLKKLRIYREQVDFLSTIPSKSGEELHYKYFKSLHIISYIPDAIRENLLETNKVRILEHYDEEYDTELKLTLKAYVNNMMDNKKTAENLKIHRNTLLNRLNRIEQVADISLESTSDIFGIFFYFLTELYKEKTHIV